MYARTRKETFVVMVLSGRAKPEQIDAFVAGWHRSRDARSLLKALGFTAAEYARWVKDPAALSSILVAHIPPAVAELAYA